MGGLTGMTINMEEVPRSELPDASQEDYGSTIDRLLQDDELQMSFPASIPINAVIPDSLQAPAPVMETPNQPSSALSMSSILQASVRLRSSVAAGRTASALGRKRPAASLVSPIGAPNRESTLLPNISSALFDDEECGRRSSNPPPPPLALFDLSGSMPSTLNQIQLHVGRFSESAHSFQTAANTGAMTQLLVPATQYCCPVVEGDPATTLLLLPTTPTAQSSGALSVEIPPTQYPQHLEVPSTQYEEAPRVLAPQTQMSQMDIFHTESETIPGTMSLTDPSEPSFTTAIVCTPSFPESFTEPAVVLPPSQAHEPSLAPPFLPASQLLASIAEEPFSGHETVLLPDSCPEETEEDEEDNPFIEEDDGHRISEPPYLPSQPPAAMEAEELDCDEKENEDSFRSQEATLSLQDDPEPSLKANEPSREAFVVPRTGRRVRFVPTPVDSSLPPVPTAIHEAHLRARTDTQELEDAFTTSLHKLCQQVVTGTRFHSGIPF